MTRPDFIVVRWWGEALPAGLNRLRSEAAAEGYRFLQRIDEESAPETGIFGRPPAALFFVSSGTELVGIGGLTPDPYDPAAGCLRLRHVYVLPAFRRLGAARMLADTLIAQGFATARTLTLRVPDERAAAFWEAMGFFPVAHPSRTHERIAA